MLRATWLWLDCASCHYDFMTCWCQVSRLSYEMVKRELSAAGVRGVRQTAKVARAMSKEQRPPTRRRGRCAHASRLIVNGCLEFVLRYTKLEWGGGAVCDERMKEERVPWQQGMRCS